jgi:hypothetical protein
MTDEIIITGSDMRVKKVPLNISVLLIWGKESKLLKAEEYSKYIMEINEINEGYMELNITFISIIDTK